MRNLSRIPAFSRTRAGIFSTIWSIPSSSRIQRCVTSFVKRSLLPDFRGAPQEVISERTARNLVRTRNLQRAFEGGGKTCARNRALPFDAKVDIYRAGRLVVNAINPGTPVRDAGDHYYVTSRSTISAPLPWEEKYSPDITSRYDADVPGEEPEAGAPGASALPEAPAGRVLILDQDRDRSALRVAELIEAGSDAVAIASADEGFGISRRGQVLQPCQSAALKSPSKWPRACRARPCPVHDDLRKAVQERLTREAPPSTDAPSRPEPVAGDEAAAPDTSASTQPVHPQGAYQPQASVASPGRDRIRVLVAEDNDVNQIVFEQIS